MIRAGPAGRKYADSPGRTAMALEIAIMIESPI
jgi:hypothetical protein